MPDAFNQPLISVNSPTGFRLIENPLYNYTFHPQPPASDFPPTDSVRYPPIFHHISGSRYHACLGLHDFYITWFVTNVWHSLPNSLALCGIPMLQAGASPPL